MNIRENKAWKNQEKVISIFFFSYLYSHQTLETSALKLFTVANLRYQLDL